MVRRNKYCYCHSCDKYFHWLGITRHRAMHRDRRESVKITYTKGNTEFHDYKNYAKQ